MTSLIAVEGKRDQNRRKEGRKQRRKKNNGYGVSHVLERGCKQKGAMINESQTSVSAAGSRSSSEEGRREENLAAAARREFQL
jgi:hypothetical protein